MRNVGGGEFRELHLFPGVEISVNGGFHLLAIFDKSATTSDIDSLLGHVQYDGSKGDSDGVTRMGPAEVVQAVIDAGALPVPAHADDAKGLLRREVDSNTKAALDANTIRQVLATSGIHAMEIVNVNEPLPELYNQSKVGWTKVVGSDCHSFHHGYANLPGSKFSWIKMAEPSLEGLRLALLDGNSTSVIHGTSSSFDPFQKPEHFIESLEVSKLSFMGRGKSECFKFSPYLNAVVGGRGTGKSTIVHALRLAYGRERELITLPLTSEPRQTFERFNRVQKSRGADGGLLQTTALTLIVQRDGVRYRISRMDGMQSTTVEEFDVDLNDWKPSASQTIASNRFPVKIFSQGQIAALASDGQEALLNIIDDLGKIDTFKNAAAEAIRVFYATRATLRELNGRLIGRDALNVSLSDITRKLKRFEEVGHAHVLKRFQLTSLQAEEVSRQIEHLNDISEQISSLADDVKKQGIPDGLFSPDEDSDVIEILGKIASAIGAARNVIEGAADDLSACKTTLALQLAESSWKARVDASGDAYRAVQAEFQPQGGDDSPAFGDFVKERQRLEAESRRLDAILVKRDETLALAREQWKNVLATRVAVSTARSEFLQGTLNSNRFVKITLLPYGRNDDEIERSLRDLLGCADRYSDEIYCRETDDRPASGLVGLLFNQANLAATVEGGFEDGLKTIRKNLTLACQGTDVFGARLNKYLVAEAEKRPEFVDQILCWFPEDRLSIEHSRKGDGTNFQPIGQASAGQRAAAMLAFLLAHGTDPLVLDQPEDDLDNYLIYDLVVTQIRENKQRRQIVVVTHNPNIVVNGDAEMLYALDFNSQCFVKRSGSLQSREIREEICQVMEGGREAFERRYQRLGHAL
jgi:hypothetical protein